LHHPQHFDLDGMDQMCNDYGEKHWKAKLPFDCTSNNIYWMSCCKTGQVKVDLLKETSTLLEGFA
jgi:hypothetical protein